MAAAATGAPEGTIRFGLFDWLDQSGASLERTYEERLQVLEFADSAGFYCYHNAEHHGTALSWVPSPNLFLASVAQRTKHLRVGPLAYVLPLYNPLRLLEEICMLDNLSGGRLEIGVSRGVSPFEFAPYGVRIEEGRAIFKEVFDILLMGLTTGRLSYQGQYFQYDDVSTEFRPLQQPHPPLWYPTSNASSIDWVASQGISTAFGLHLAPSLAAVEGMFSRYWGAWEEHKNDPNRLNGQVARPNVALSTHVYVADTDERAVAEARQAYSRFHHNFLHLRMPAAEMARYADPLAFDNLLQAGKFIVGSPATVKARVSELVSAMHTNYLLGNFTFGSLTLEQTLTSLRLFADEVMPAFVRQPAAA
ncbi:MAG: LLM class flavin-dependent oxidoreductase [Chloroflexota bacterium]